MIIIAIPIAMILIFGITKYFEGRKGYRKYHTAWSTPILVGGNPLFWFWDKFYAAGWYSAARKGE